MFGLQHISTAVNRFVAALGGISATIEEANVQLRERLQLDVKEAVILPSNRIAELESDAGNGRKGKVKP